MEAANLFTQKDDYDSFVHHVIPKYEEMQACVVQAMIEKAGKPFQVLDLGCGTGKTLEMILSAYPEACVTGIDASASMLTVAAARLQHFSAARLTLQQGDILESAYPPGNDVVMSFATFNNFSPHYLPQVYRQMYDALQPGGICIHADFIRHESPQVHAKLEEAYKRHVTASINDPYFIEEWFSDANGYFPAMLTEHFNHMEKAGFENSELLFLYVNQAVFRAFKK